MTYDMYRYVFIGAAILCGIMFVLSIVIFIFLKIPKTISGLSGATDREENQNTGEQNEAFVDGASSGGVVQHQVQMYGVDAANITPQEWQVEGSVFFDGMSSSETTNAYACTIEYEITFIHTNEVIAMEDI